MLTMQTMGLKIKRKFIVCNNKGGCTRAVHVWKPSKTKSVARERQTTSD